MELSNKQRNEIAEEIAEYWKYNCTDEEFYYNCRDTLHEQLEYEYGFNPENEDCNREYSIIINLINEVYSKDNWRAIKFFDEQAFGGVYIAQYEDVIINDVTIKGVWSIELEYNQVVLYNAVEEEIGRISYYNIVDIKVGGNDGTNDI